MTKIGVSCKCPESNPRQERARLQQGVCGLGKKTIPGRNTCRRRSDERSQLTDRTTYIRKGNKTPEVPSVTHSFPALWATFTGVLLFRTRRPVVSCRVGLGEVWEGCIASIYIYIAYRRFRDLEKKSVRLKLGVGSIRTFARSGDSS